MKVLVAAGMYDSFLPCAVGGEIERQLPPSLRQSLTFKCYAGGHAMYEDAPARAELSHDVKALIEAAVQQATPPAAAAGATTAVADSLVLSPEPIAPAVSHHTLHLGKLRISYVATWSSMSLKDAAGVPQATISATSYVRENVSGGARRPILFAFNGGPGASSSPLHFGILARAVLAPRTRKARPLSLTTPTHCSMRQTWC